MSNAAFVVIRCPTANRSSVSASYGSPRDTSSRTARPQYLIDPRTQYLYSVPGSAAEWPVHLGKVSLRRMCGYTSPTKKNVHKSEEWQDDADCEHVCLYACVCICACVCTGGSQWPADPVHRRVRR